MLKIDIIAGARPNFMKIAPIIRAINAAIQRGSALSYRLIHTGQHYDQKMSGDFFTQLGIPSPHVNLEAGSGTQATQTAAIMTRYEKVLMEDPAHLCIVVGDVTSTMACAIVAKKMNMQVAHVEAGIRSRDLTMPEEINRMVTDAITDHFFTTSEVANQNLLKEGHDASKIHWVGNTMIDTLLANQDNLIQPEWWHEAGLDLTPYLVLTLHRPANVDDANKLNEYLQVIGTHAHDWKVIFPVHPRTRQIIERAGISMPPNIFTTDPLDYHRFIYIVKHAKGVITDSGGITEETTVLQVPCMTLRDNTERPETIDMGTNELIGTNPAAIIPALELLRNGTWKTGTTPPFWDGKTGERVVRVIEGMNL